jgi:hypothetical protein
MVVAHLPYEVQDQSTTAEGPKSMAQYQGLIDELDRRGLINRRKVGLQGCIGLSKSRVPPQAKAPPSMT